jgi:hypothetical protein
MFRWKESDLPGQAVKEGLVSSSLEGINSIRVALGRSSAHWLGTLGTVPTTISTNKGLGDHLCVFLAAGISQSGCALHDHTRSLIVDTSDLFLDNEFTTVGGKRIDDFERLFTVYKLVTVERRNTRSGLSTRPFLVRVDIRAVTLQWQNQGVERKGSEVGVYKDQSFM